MINNNLNAPEKPIRHRGAKVFKIIGFTLVGVVMACLFALLFGYVVKILWNWLMPAVFGLGTITYWQAFGLILLAKLLFGGFGHHHDKHRHHDHMQWKMHWKWHDKQGFPAGHKDHKNWKYYHQFWEEEGKSAFDAYVSKIEDKKEDQR